MMKNTIIYVIAVIAATGGLLFGFDTGVISGAIPFFQKDFGLDNSMVELVTSAGLVCYSWRFVLWKDNRYIGT